MEERHLPLKPKTAKDLLVGDFFPLFLDNGKYGCGQVIELKGAGAGSKSVFFAGILDWIGNVPPTADQITNRKLLEDAMLGMIFFKLTPAEILGNISVDSEYMDRRNLLIGFKSESWGYEYISGRANYLLDQTSIE